MVNWRFIVVALLPLFITIVVPKRILKKSAKCPDEKKYGPGPPSSCTKPTDPNKKPPSKLEKWFTEEMFKDLFPYANIGWGPNDCWPYSYKSFIIAARYFPGFGTTSPKNGLSEKENTRRDLAAFFAHAIQETGLNDILSKKQADDCFYRGGLFNWFEGGPISSFIGGKSPGYKPADGNHCTLGGKYCSPSDVYPCGADACYFGRGAIQISYNYNYGQFQNWLATKNIKVNLLKQPNLIMTKMNPPLALMASLWFYMTPQPPKPAMHDIILGRWYAGKKNKEANYFGPIFGPTSLIINNECNGLDAEAPGGGGENRRIRAFKWFCDYYGVKPGKDETLSCKGMPQKFDQIAQNMSYQPDWSNMWKNEPCQCAPALYAGNIPYYEPGYYPDEFIKQNAKNKNRCVQQVYKTPAAFNLDPNRDECLKSKPSKKTSVSSTPADSQSVMSTITPIKRLSFVQANGSLPGYLEINNPIVTNVWN